MVEEQEETVSRTSVGKNKPREDDYVTAGQLLLEMAKVLALALVIIIPVRVFLFQPFFVQGASMEPNFEDGEYLVVSEFGYKLTSMDFGGFVPAVHPFRELTRQEPVVFKYPKNPDQFFIKRVIGLPGEKVEIKSGKIIITPLTGEPFALDESAYLQPSVSAAMADMPAVSLSNDQYFVMGDNRSYSYDSRAFGPIGRDAVIGPVLLRAWPVSRFETY